MNVLSRCGGAIFVVDAEHRIERAAGPMEGPESAYGLAGTFGGERS